MLIAVGGYLKSIKCHSSFYQSSSFISATFNTDPDCTGAANRHALGTTAAQVAVVDIIISFNQRIKGAGI